MKKLTACLIILIVAGLITGCEQGDKTIVLKYKFAPGLTLEYDQVMKRSYRVTQADTVVEEQSGEYRAEIVQEVTEVDEQNVATLREGVTWFYEMPAKDDSTVVDTVKEERTLLYKVKPDGDILDVKFLSEDDVATRSYIKNYLEQGVPVFPSGEVSPGFSWTQSAKVIMPDETMEAKTTYEVKSLVREYGFDCAVIEFDGNLIIPVEPNPEDSIKRSGINFITSTGKIYFAYKEGLVVLQRERWVIDGEREVIRPGKDKPEYYHVAVESDVDFQLKDRSASGQIGE